jgi:hypothetical protein
VSTLIPDYFPDNSVACHAWRLGRESQGQFASASGMGVRCDRDKLPFFPNIYNEDWFFFADQAARHAILEVGRSRQRVYDPFANPKRAVMEEFGDLLAEGLYARLDAGFDLFGVDIRYWERFIEGRRSFLGRVLDALDRHPERDEETDEGREVVAAKRSILAARGQLEGIRPELCQKFIDLWQADLERWYRYLDKLPSADTVTGAFELLGLDAVGKPSPSWR